MNEILHCASILRNVTDRAHELKLLYRNYHMFMLCDTSRLVIKTPAISITQFYSQRKYITHKVNT